MSDIQKLSGLRVGFAVCGSFCTFSRAFEQLEQLSALGCELTPIMSHNAYSLDTRFGAAQEHAARLYEITGRTVLHDITATEPVGPKKMFDVLVGRRRSSTCLLSVPVRGTPWASWPQA